MNASSTHSRQKRSLDSVGQDRDINGGLIDKGDLGKNVTSLNEPGDKHEATDYHYYTNYDNEPVFGDAGIARYAPGDAKDQTQAKGEDNAIICDMALVLLI